MENFQVLLPLFNKLSAQLRVHDSGVYHAISISKQ